MVPSFGTRTATISEPCASHEGGSLSGSDMPAPPRYYAYVNVLVKFIVFAEGAGAALKFYGWW